VDSCEISFHASTYNSKETLGRARQDRFHTSASRTLYQERQRHRAFSGQQARFAQRARLRNEDADVFHQSRRENLSPSRHAVLEHAKSLLNKRMAGRRQSKRRA